MIPHAGFASRRHVCPKICPEIRCNFRRRKRNVFQDAAHCPRIQRTKAVIDSAHTDKINAFVASDQRRKGFSKVAERHTVYAVGSEFSVQRRTGAGLRGYLEAAARDFSRQFEQRNAEADASG